MVPPDEAIWKVDAAESATALNEACKKVEVDKIMKRKAKIPTDIVKKIVETPQHDVQVRND